MRLRTLIVFAIIVLVALPAVVPSGHSSGGSSAIIYVSPSRIGPPGSNQTFYANVNLYLPPGLTVGAYDIVLREFNVTDIGIYQVVTPTNITAGNLFPSDQYLSVANCVNGSGTGCTGDDGGGRAHSAVASGISISGPLNGTIFTVGFKVLSKGSAVLQPQNDTLVSGTNAAALVPHALTDGLFSNSGLSAVFSVVTAIPIVNRPISFDASASFNPKNQTADYMSKLNYSWNFGDGKTKNQFSPLVTHNFTTVQLYQVGLKVTDEYGASSTFKRTLAVGTALGSLQLDLKDQNSNQLPLNVTVTLSNGTQANQIFENVTKTASNSPQIFFGLVAGTYTVSFSSPGIDSSSKQEDVTAGWTTIDTIYLTVHYRPPAPPGPDVVLTDLLIAIGIIGAGVALGVVALVQRRGLSKKKRKNKG